MGVKQAKVAYFSMEIGLSADIPTYSGGLGVLAGDTIKAAADLGVPMVAVTLLYRQGYFNQTIDEAGRQHAAALAWNIEDKLSPVTGDFAIEVEGKAVRFRVWCREVTGATGHAVPVYFLDSDLPDNDAYHRTLSHTLYGGDERYRLCQEALLALGGLEFLRSQAPTAGLFRDDQEGVFHLNEGHAALLGPGLLCQRVGSAGLAKASTGDREWVKQRCVFTTHTPVPAGHDRFSEAMVEMVVGAEITDYLRQAEVIRKGMLNMTDLALEHCRYVNGVAKRHGEVSRKMFPGRTVESITNGIHALTWAQDDFIALFDKRVPGWRHDGFHLRYMCEAPLEEITAAHRAGKRQLFDAIERAGGPKFDLDVFTIGFARRAATYKRLDLLFDDAKALAQLTKQHGPMQLVFAGKAHPKDEGGQELIRRVHEKAAQIAGDQLRFVYLQNYDMDWGRLICAGVDLWLNNPIRPLEASGTSGMKAALNGVPSFSTIDGWWVEGWVEGVTGWEIADNDYASDESSLPDDHRQETAANLYRKLGEEIVSLYYKNPQAYAAIRRHCISLNGSHFNTHRMVLEYAMQAYRLPVT